MLLLALWGLTWQSCFSKGSGYRANYILIGGTSAPTAARPIPRLEQQKVSPSEKHPEMGDLGAPIAKVPYRTASTVPAPPLTAAVNLPTSESLLHSGEPSSAEPGAGPRRIEGLQRSGGRDVSGSSSRASSLAAKNRASSARRPRASAISTKKSALNHGARKLSARSRRAYKKPIVSPKSFFESILRFFGFSNPRPIPARDSKSARRQQRSRRPTQVPQR